MKNFRMKILQKRKTRSLFFQTHFFIQKPSFYETITKKCGTTRQAIDYRARCGAKKSACECRLIKVKIRGLIVFNVFFFRLLEALRLPCISIE